MSTNHYTNTPPSQMNLHSVNINSKRTDYFVPPNTNIPWTSNCANVFENREKYMETQELTDEHYSCDTNANQSELPDDEPYPPPDLKRLVTGQTVSFEEDPNSPTFDRIVPGEGNAFSNYPASVPSSNGERFPASSFKKDCNPTAPNLLKIAPKKEVSGYNNNFLCENNSVSNSSSQNFFDNCLNSLNSQEDKHIQQQFINKYGHPSFNSSGIVKLQQGPSKLSLNSFESFDNRNTAFQNCPPYSSREPIAKTNENIQFDNGTNKRVVTSDSREPKIRQDLYNEKPQLVYEQELRRHHPFEVTSNVNLNHFTSQVVEPSENTENVILFQNNVNTDSRKDDNKFRKIISTNRMAVEGAPDNIPYLKPMPSSTPVQSPNYDFWYQNNRQNPYKDVRNNNNFNSNNKSREEKSSHLMQNSQQPHAQLAPANVFQGSFDSSVHSKTPSISSNTNSVTKIFSHHQTEVCTTDRPEPRLCDLQASTGRLNECEFRNHDSKTSKTDSATSRSQTVDDKTYDRCEPTEIDDGYNENEIYANVDSAIHKKEAPFPIGIDPRAEQHNSAGPPISAYQDILSSKDSMAFRKNSLVENQERPDGDACESRGTVPGAQRTPTDLQNRQFLNSSGNISFGYQSKTDPKTENNEEEKKQTSPYTDSDENYMDQRMVVGYNCNTSSELSIGSSKLMQNKKSSKIKPPLETRMVVGETSSDVSKVNLKPLAHHGRNKERAYGENNNRQMSRDGRFERSRMKSSRCRNRITSDEDYDEEEQSHSMGIDQGSRSFHGGHPRNSHRRPDRRTPGADFESSFTQDESYSEDEDVDYEYDSSRHSHTLYGRRSNRRSNYDRRIRDSRPSSRSGSEFRHEHMGYSNEQRCIGRKPPGYEYLDHQYFRTNLSQKDSRYWSRIRNEDPQAYVIWFRSAFQKEYRRWYNMYIRQQFDTYQAGRRGSGHSGQSSLNNDSLRLDDERLMIIKELSISKRAESNMVSIVQEQSNGPFKYNGTHVKGLFSILGQLVVVGESSPKENVPAKVDFYKVLPPDYDTDVVEFMNFTGPFISGETHPNTVSEFMRKHAQEASTSSERLLYLLIDLIIKLRGVTDGIAISELLMNSYREYENSLESPKNESTNYLSNMNEKEIVDKYTNLLLQGNKNAALEFAVDHKLWGHAFLLASKMGNKYYINMLAKFDSSIPMNSPIKTLYQLYSNQIPQAATACIDEKWSDWRPHLAMILSNPTPNNEIYKASIITLGDSLGDKDIFAAHFCYLAAEIDFGSANKSSTKLTLLSLRNNYDQLEVNTCNHAILLTQAYEFAKRLQRKDFTIYSLVPYKYLLATRLIDFNRNNIALQYLEAIATDVVKSPSDENFEVMYNVLELAERIMYAELKSLVVDSAVDKMWLTTLRKLVEEKSVFTEVNPQPMSNESQFSKQQEQPLYQLQPAAQLPSMSILQQPQMYSVTPLSSEVIQLPFMFQSQHASQRQPASSVSTQPCFNQSQESQSSWDANSYSLNTTDALSSGFNQANIQKRSTIETNLHEEETDTVGSSPLNECNQGPMSDQQNFYSPWDQPQGIGQISMHSTSNNYYNNNNPQPVRTQQSTSFRIGKSPSPVPPRPSKRDDEETKEKKSENGGSGWLSFLKLPLKKSNQAHLPDDKNPPLIFDPQKGRWVDKDKKGDDEVNDIKPPPKALEVMSFKSKMSNPSLNASNPAHPSGVGNFQVGMQDMQVTPRDTSSNQMLGAAQLVSNPFTGATSAFSGSSNNIYKLPRGKSMKTNYVNIFAQNSTSSPSNTSAPTSAMDMCSRAQIPTTVNSFAPSSGV